MLKRACGLALLLSTSVFSADKDDANFTALAEQVWQFSLNASPLSAGYFGMDPRPADMPDLSKENLEKQYKTRLAQLGLLKDLNATELSEQNQINLAILKHRLQNKIDEYKFKSYQIPLTAEGGFHTSLGFIPRFTNLKSKQDVNNYIRRLSSFPVYFDAQIAHMKDGLAAGNSQPQVVLAGFETSIDGFIVSEPDQSLFYSPLKKLDFLSDAERQTLQIQAQQVIKSNVVPSFKKFRRFMLDTYIPQARATIGVKETPNGAEFYQNRAEHYTTTDLTAEQIHEIGLAEVKRIRAEMAQIIEQVEFKGSFAEFLKFLRTDPQFYPKTARELLTEASYIAKKWTLSCLSFLNFYLGLLTV